MNQRIARALGALLLVAATVAGTAAPAAAGGTWLAPVRDRYEVGDSATLVGYVGAGSLGWVQDGPFYGYLLEAGTAPEVPSARGEPLGPITIEETGTGGWTALRVSLEVPLEGLAPGRYEVRYCNDPCRNGLGDLIGSRPINVGVAPAEPLVREWPLDEPLIRILAPDALVSGPGYLAPASEIRAGRVVPAPPAAAPAAPAPPIPVPTVLPTPPVPPTLVVAPPPTASSSPAVVSAQAPASASAYAPAATRAAADGSDDDSPLLVFLGVVLVAACTGAVLWALRREGPEPGAPPAARPA